MFKTTKFDLILMFQTPESNWVFKLRFIGADFSEVSYVYKYIYIYIKFSLFLFD